MTRPNWNECYETGDLPWDTAEPDEHLVELVGSGTVTPGRALDIGCGTGTHALWMASRGFDVVGVDVSVRAVELARAKAEAASGPGRCTFAVLDFLTDDPPGGPFDLVFDRGCFHIFDEAAQRARFAERVARVLDPRGVWLSLLGSTEGPPRDHGPPRRSARDITNAIEPVLEISMLRATVFDAPNLPTAARSWLCMASPRAVPAQPSTQRE